MYQAMKFTEVPPGAVILDQGLKDFVREWNEDQARKKDNRPFRYHAENGGKVLVVEDVAGEFHVYYKESAEQAYDSLPGFSTLSEANKTAEAMAGFLGAPAQYGNTPWLDPDRQNKKGICCFHFQSDNGGQVSVDEDVTGYYFVLYQPGQDRKLVTYLDFKSRIEANEAAEAMVPRVLKEAVAII